MQNPEKILMNQHSYNYIERRELLVTSLILLFFVVVYYYPLMTNEYTPGGDGWRIFPFIEFVNHADSFYPLWNPYLLGGIPTIASPERFMWLGNLINSSSIYANAFINAAFLILILLFSVSTYILARKVKISHFGAIIVVLVLIYSWYFTRTVYCGRINSIALLCYYNFSYYLYLRYVQERKLTLLLCVILLTGWIICNAGYYAIVTYFPVLFLIRFYSNQKKNRNIPFTANILFEISIIGCLGVLSFSVILLPMIYYLFANYSTTDSLFGLSKTLPNLSEFANIFFLVQEEHGKTATFLFISIFSLPLLALLFLNRKIFSNSPIIIFLIISSIGLIFLAGKIYPFKFIVDIFENTIVLKQIRWGSTFIYLMTFGIAFLSGYGFDAAKYYPIRQRFKAFIPILLVIILLAVFFTFDVVESLVAMDSFTFKAFIQDSYLLNLKWGNPWKHILLFGILSYPYTILNERDLKLYIFILVCLQASLFRVNITVPPVDNKSTLSNIINILNKDHSDFKIIAIDGGERWTLSPIGMPKVKALNGFSLYFSKENRWQLEHLLKRNIYELRTHWIKEWSDISEWNEGTLKLLNVKYLIIKGKLNDRMSKNWEFTTSDSGFSLYRKIDWENAFRLFDNWKIMPSIDDILLEMKDPLYDPFKTLLITEKTEIDQSSEKINFINEVKVEKFSEEKMHIHVNSSKNAILFIPQYFDTGWKVKVDNIRKRVLRTNASFRGVEIQKGKHTVYMYYSPVILKLAIAISFFTILVLIVICYKNRKYKWN